MGTKQFNGVGRHKQDEWWTDMTPQAIRNDLADPLGGLRAARRRRLTTDSRSAERYSRRAVRVEERFIVHTRIASQAIRFQAVGISDRFGELADRWERETAHLSDLAVMRLHPAYQKIISLGWAVVPDLIERVASGDAHWNFALTTITDENPAAGAETPRDAAQAWADWGKRLARS